MGAGSEADRHGAGPACAGDELVQVLRRWQESGAVWRVLRREPRATTVALLRCDAGEEVERLSSDDPGWLAYLHDRSGSDD